MPFSLFWSKKTPLKVDQEGIEPSSKRGHQKLSTCLSLTKFSSYSKTRATNYNLIL